MVCQAEVGRLRAIGISKEPTNGSLTAASYWVAVEEGQIDYKNTKTKDTSAIGRIEDSVGVRITKEWSETSFGGLVRPNFIGLLLYSAFGAVNTAANADVSGLVYDHTFSVEQSNCHKSLSIRQTDEIEGQDSKSIAASYNMLSELSITAEVDNYVKFNASFMGKKPTEETEVTPSFSLTMNDVFTSAEVSVKLADTEAGLTGATAIPLRKITLTVNKNVEDFTALGSLEPSTIHNKQFIISGEMERLYKDTTYKDLFNSNTSKYMQVSIKSSNTIGTAENNEIKFILNRVDLENWTLGGGLDDIISETFGFVCSYNSTDTEVGTCILTNLVASY